MGAPARVLTRALRETRALERITVLALDDTQALAARAREEVGSHVDR
jgi:hypothetical protein